MRAWRWVIVAAAGWGAMFVAYNTRTRAEFRTPWGYGMIVVGPELPAAVARTGHTMRVRMRNLPAIERTEMILSALSQAGAAKSGRLDMGLRPRLFLLALNEAGIDQSLRRPKSS